MFFSAADIEVTPFANSRFLLRVGNVHDASRRRQAH
jgi:hypothetical protein